LDDVHGVVVLPGEIGAGDAQQDARDGHGLAHVKVVLVAFVGGHVGLVKVVGPNRVEGRDVARHAGQ